MDTLNNDLIIYWMMAVYHNPLMLILLYGLVLDQASPNEETTLKFSKFEEKKKFQSGSKKYCVIHLLHFKPKFCAYLWFFDMKN